MSTNLRKAQKHMQRAKELLDPESQLGFGGSDDHAITLAEKRKMEALEEELQKKQKVEALDLNMVPDQQIRNVADHLDSCEDVCKWQAASRRFKNAEINEKLKQKLSLDPENKWPEKKWTLFTACQKCQHNKSGHTDLARKGRIRVGPIPDWKFSEMWKERNQKRISLGSKPQHEPQVPDIDLILQIHEVTEWKRAWSAVTLTCSVFKDMNGEFLKRTKLSDLTERFIVNIHFRDSENQHIQIFYKVLWLGNIALKWEELKPILQKSPSIKFL
jgi:small-conductance mechanosensitive channel